MWRRFREAFGRRWSTTAGYDSGALSPADEIPAAKLIADLGLEIGRIAARDFASWQPSARILVMGASPARLDWLRAAAGPATLVGGSTAEDGERLVADADALIGWFTPAMLDRGGRLRWLQLQRAGAEGLAGHPRVSSGRIVVTSLKRLASPIVADHAMALTLALVRRLPILLAHQQRRRWAQADVNAAALGTLLGSTMLVAGFGGIGSAVARRAMAFGMTVTAVRASVGPAPPFVDRVGGPEDLLAFAAEADVIVNALPLTEATRGLFDAEFFARLRPGAIFVNVGRGASVVIDDLTRALGDGLLAGAALDVTDPQPLPQSHPLWKMPNVIITPHVASWSGVTSAWGWVIARENLRRYVAGEPLVSMMDPARGY